MKSLILVMGAFLMVTGCTSEVTHEVVREVPAVAGPVASEGSSDMASHQTIGSKKQGWSASGKLLSGDRSRKVNLQADFPTPESYVVEFYVKARASLTAPSVYSFPARTKALITWSVEGNSVSRIVDVANGVSVQGVGQAVRVVMYDDSQTGGVIDGEYEVSMQVAPGSRGTDAIPPTYTSIETPASGSPQFTVAPGAQRLITIPQNAGVKSYGVFLGIDPITDWVVVGQLKDLNILSLQVVQVEQSGLFFPLVAGADSIVVSAPLSNTGDALTTIVFGIDG